MDKKIKTSRLDEFKKRVEEMRNEYKTDKKAFIEKMKSLSEPKKEIKKSEPKKIFNTEEPKLWFDKEKMEEFINKLKKQK